MPNTLRLASSPIDSFVDYFLDTKPYHTKILEVVETYTFTEEMIVSMEEAMEKDILIENDPLCKQTGFGLDYDDECGYDAVDCCDLFDCFAGYGFIFDNSDMLLNLPVLGYQVEDDINDIQLVVDGVDELNEAWLEVEGNFLTDKRLPIKRILLTSVEVTDPNTGTSQLQPRNQLIFDGDVSSFFNNPADQTLTTTFLIVDIQQFVIDSVVNNIVSITGNHVPFFITRNNFFVIGQEFFTDKRFYYNKVEFNPSTGNTDIYLLDPLSSTPDGSLDNRLMQIRTDSPNVGIYQSFDVEFDGSETIVTLYEENGLAPNVNPASDDYSLGSVQLRTSLNSPRLLTVFDSNLYPVPVLDEDDDPVLDVNGDPVFVFENREEELKILYSEYYWDSNTNVSKTRIFVEGNLSFIDSVAPEDLRVRTFGYFFEPGFDGGEECTPPKAENIHTRFYESLLIEVFDGEIPEYCTSILCPTPPDPTPILFGINEDAINETEING